MRPALQSSRLPVAILAAFLVLPGRISQAQAPASGESRAPAVLSWPAPQRQALIPEKRLGLAPGPAVAVPTLGAYLNLPITTSFFVQSSLIEMTAKICNGGVSETGTLRLELWAYASPFNPGESGYKVAESATIGGLTSNMCQSFDSGQRPVLAPPPDGFYYPVLFLTEQTGSSGNNGFTYDDYVTVGPNTVTVATGLISPTPYECVLAQGGMCIDNQPGDGRFRIVASYETSQNGGRSGSGNAISLFNVGVVHGGVFWFFTADNPELLIKVLPACSVNGHFWVFGSAGTNVGLTITVTDQSTGKQRVYGNTDLNPAQPIQDTGAFACP